MFVVDLRASWLGRHTLFRFPVAPILRWIGGAPIDRSAQHGTVRAAIENFLARPRWVPALSPEGARRRVDRWKKGFNRTSSRSTPSALRRQVLHPGTRSRVARRATLPHIETGTARPASLPLERPVSSILPPWPRRTRRSTLDARRLSTPWKGPRQCPTE